MTSDDVIVTAMLLAICVVAIAVIGATCRILANYRPKATFARCRGASEFREYEAIESLRPSLEQKGRCALETTNIEPRSVFRSPPTQDAGREEVSSNGSEEGRSRPDQGIVDSIDCLGGDYPPDRKQDDEGVARWSRNGASAVHCDVVEVAEDEALAPPTAASAASSLATRCDDDAVLQAIISEGVASSSAGVQCVPVVTGALQRALSCDSVMSDTSAADVMLSEANKIGQLEFGLHYDSELCDLVVNVIQAKDLERNPVTGSQDSYVRLWLAPRNDERKYQTKTQKNSVNPDYSERFRFRVVPGELDESVVQFQVYSCDRYARQKLLGETEVRLGDIDLRQSVRVWMSLHDMDQRPVSFGDVLFSMAYLPTAERLTVVIAKARNLHCPLAKQSSTAAAAADCFAKVHILQKGKKVAKKKTSKKHEARNPIFNEAMTFSVPASSLLSVQLRISIYVIQSDRGTAGGSVGGDDASDVQPVGHVTVGPRSGGMELVHWTQTMTSLRKPVTMWHSLSRD